MILLSYARENRDALRQFENELSCAKLPYLRDITRVEGDVFWRQQMAANIERSTMLVVLWSRAAHESPYIDQEIRAFHRKIFFLPLDDTPLPILAVSLPPEQAMKTLTCYIEPSAQPSAVTTVDDQAYDHLRDLRLDEEQVRLEHFISHCGRPPQLEINGHQAINHRDGTLFESVHGFFLARDPVTNAQFARFIELTGYPAPPTWQRAQFSHPDLPVTGVTWFESLAYAAWVGATLPTEAEWEKAGRARPGDTYATTSGLLDPSLAHYGCALDENAPCAVDAFPANGRGLRGMCGNVWDWCLDGSDKHKALRGGGYMDSATYCQISAHYRNFPIDRDCCVGFRLKVVHTTR